jgi:hypothetical protein
MPVTLRPVRSPSDSKKKTGDAVKSSEAKSDRGRSTDVSRSSVVGVVETWLAGLDLTPADAVRAATALVVARELDDPKAPRSVRPRVAGELRALLGEIGGTADKLGGNGAVDVRGLLLRVAP